MPVCLWNGCIVSTFGPASGAPVAPLQDLLKSPIPYVSEMSGNRRRRRHHGADQVRASAAALASFEIPIAGRGAAFSRLHDVGIHAEAHRASRLAPFKAGIKKDTVQSFLLRRALDCLRAR